MEGYKTVTASKGYEFKITGLDGHPQATREYREDACGNVSFDALPHAELSCPDIELVEIPKPKPEPITLECCGGTYYLCRVLRDAKPGGVVLVGAGDFEVLDAWPCCGSDRKFKHCHGRA